MIRNFLCLFLGSALSLPAVSQVPARPLLTGTINESELVTLPGTVNPLARAQFDRGAVSDSFPTGRLLLLLNRPQERTAALNQYLQDVHTPGSAAFHQWLTPAQFGDRFGPADSDVQKISAWLSEEGFQVTGTSKGRTLIEFSATAGQIGQAFHTQIHKYEINGEAHYANAGDMQIPEALAGIVRGISAINDFRPKPELHVAGTAHLDPKTHRITPDLTLTGNKSSFYAIGPEDFATQYDLTPLYAAGINGNGVTIGVINDSNIDVNLASGYRSLFKLSNNTAQVVLDGGDPGVNGDATEAYLDVELAGAVAPQATVNLYIASWDTAADALDDPLILAARRAIDDNQADVLSVSFGECEAGIGPADNQILNELWEQAAAQGQTVLVSAGDNGSAGCDSADQQVALYGLQVNGFASTPWNVAVGGTDFYYSDYATGAPSAASAWNSANDANLGSLKATLPEQVWNDSQGLDAINPTNTNPATNLYTIAAGSGGASGCINSVLTPQAAFPFVCNPISTTSTVKGYAKPNWQSGAGTPADGVRDLPDVSLFAGNGYNLSAYAICAAAGDCVPDANQQVSLTLVGGTSASAQAMAGIMALVDQKYGRQGQADYTLYALAQQKPPVFHDITLGGNHVSCQVYNGVPSADCTIIPNGSYPNYSTLTGYSASAGYDLASGLGTVDANALVTNWNAVSMAATTTSLQLSSTSFTHGTPVKITTTVDSASGGATPQGVVSVLTNSTLEANQSAGFLALGSNGSASGSFDTLPGGTYQLWANYGGDATHAGSYSTAASITVSPEPSTVGLSAFQTSEQVSTYNPGLGCTPIIGNLEQPISSGSSVYPDTPLWFSAQPRGSVSNLTTATGSVTFTVDSKQWPVALNSAGAATWISPMNASGTHTVVATYQGDASYGPATSSAFTYTVSPFTAAFAISPSALSTASMDESHGFGCYPGNQCSAYQGDNLPVAVFLSGGPCFIATGTVTLTLGTQTQTVPLTPGGYPVGQVAVGFATFTNLQPGTYQLTGSYSGDSNFAPATSSSYTVSVAATPNPLLATTTTVSVSPSQVNWANGEASFNVTVTGPGSSTTPPTGYIDLYGEGTEMIWSSGLIPSGPNSATANFQISQVPNGNAFTPYIGTVPIQAVYLGDSNYQPSVSAVSQLTVTYPTTPDFLLATQAGQITVQPGGTTTMAVNLESMYGFNSPVALTCAPSSSQITCSINPPAVTTNGISSATLTINAAAQTAALNATRQPRWPAGMGMLAVGLFLIRRRTVVAARRWLLLSLCLVAVSVSLIGCGGGVSSSKTSSPPPPPSAATYSVLVTGTSGGLTHNAKVTVVVPNAAS